MGATASRWLGRFEFQVGTLLATGVPAGAAGRLMCVDVVQFATPPLATLLECRRVPVPEGRLVLTCWEAVDPSNERVSARIHAVNLRWDLPEPHPVDVDVHEA